MSRNSMATTKTPIANAEREARYRERRDTVVKDLRRAQAPRWLEIAWQGQILRAEIAARRKANHDEPELLDWIEEQLHEIAARGRD